MGGCKKGPEEVKVVGAIIKVVGAITKVTRAITKVVRAIIRAIKATSELLKSHLESERMVAESMLGVRELEWSYLGRLGGDFCTITEKRGSKKPQSSFCY